MRSTVLSAPKQCVIEKVLSGFGAALLFSVSIQAQISYSTRTAFDQLLQYEPIYIDLKITNQSGSDLVVGGSDTNVQLAFAVEQTPGFRVRDLDEQLLANPVRLAPHKTSTIQIEISKAYDMRKTGPYTIFPRLFYHGKVYSSGRLLVEIVPGFVKHSHTMENMGKKGATRTCSLRTINRDRAQRLFLRIDDEKAELCYGVYDLGRLLSHSPAMLESGSSGMIHVLHQSGPFQFTYNIFTPEGKPIIRKLFAKEGRIPKLVFDEMGMVQVAGVREYDGDLNTRRPEIKVFDPSQ